MSSILPEGSDSKTPPPSSEIPPQCATCGKRQWPVIHSCPGVRRPSPPRECENSIDVTPGVVWTDSQLDVIRQLSARLVAAEAAVRRVEALTYASDDGSEWDHNFGCDGEPECPACWAQSIRAALVGAR